MRRWWIYSPYIPDSVQLTFSGEVRNSPLNEVSIYHGLTVCKIPTSKHEGSPRWEGVGYTSPYIPDSVQLTFSGEGKETPTE